jgi:hypothetical protein
MQPEMILKPALGIGDLAVVGGLGHDVWELANVRHRVARVVARSIHVERGRMQSIPLNQLNRYDPDEGEGVSNSGPRGARIIPLRTRRCSRCICARQPFPGLT